MLLLIGRPSSHTRGWIEEEGMAWHRFLFRAGAVVWIAGGLGHLALIDLFTLHGRTRVATLAPHADVLATMDATTLSFGALGSTTVFRAAAGFSLWVALSLLSRGSLSAARSGAGSRAASLHRPGRDRFRRLRCRRRRLLHHPADARRGAGDRAVRGVVGAQRKLTGFLGAALYTSAGYWNIRPTPDEDQHVLRTEQAKPRPAARSVQGDRGAAPDRLDHCDEC